SGYPYSSLSGAPAINYQVVGNNGISETARNRLNLIPGTGVTLNVADNSGTNSTDITINASGGSGGSGGVYMYGISGGALTASSNTYMQLGDSGGNSGSASLRAVPA